MDKGLRSLYRKESDFVKNQPCHRLQEGEENLDGVATLVTDLASGYSTTKQNPHICNQPLYGAITRRLEWRIFVGEGLLQNEATHKGSRPN